MNVYRKYWILTSLLLVALVYGVYSGLIGWFMLKFPALQGQVISIGIIAVFLWAFLVHGHQSAKLLTETTNALSMLSRARRPAYMSAKAMRITSSRRPVAGGKRA